MDDTTPERQTDPTSSSRGADLVTATMLAWSLLAACVLLAALTLLLDGLTPDTYPFLPGERPAPGFVVLTRVLSLAYPTVGAIIASRLPLNPIGWIFCGLGLAYNLQGFAISYADYTLLQDLDLPGAEHAAWFATWVESAYPTLGVFLLLLFPDGRLPSRRWRMAAWSAGFGASLTAFGVALMPGSLFTHDYVANPFGIVGVVGGKFTTYDLFGASKVLGMSLLLVATFVALASQTLRLRHARGAERRQLAWFILRLIAQGLSNYQIGERLFLALDTVKGHNRRIFGKLSVQRRTEAVARARSLGILPRQN